MQLRADEWASHLDKAISGKLMENPTLLKTLERDGTPINSHWHIPIVTSALQLLMLWNKIHRAGEGCWVLANLTCSLYGELR